nr:MAG TPA: hypothetical protein [Caudoviricetes sp.]
MKYRRNYIFLNNIKNNWLNQVTGDFAPGM